MAWRSLPDGLLSELMRTGSMEWRCIRLLRGQVGEIWTLDWSLGHAGNIECWRVLRRSGVKVFADDWPKSTWCQLRDFHRYPLKKTCISVMAPIYLIFRSPRYWRCDTILELSALFPSREQSLRNNGTFHLHFNGLERKNFVWLSVGDGDWFPLDFWEPPSTFFGTEYQNYGYLENPTLPNDEAT